MIEPIEEVMCEVSEAVSGSIIEALSFRKGELCEMVTLPGGKQRLDFLVPSRGMIGFKVSLATPSGACRTEVQQSLVHTFLSSEHLCTICRHPAAHTP